MSHVDKDVGSVTWLVIGVQYLAMVYKNILSLREITETSARDLELEQSSSVGEING